MPTDNTPDVEIKEVSEQLLRIWLFLARTYRNNPAKWTSVADLVEARFVNAAPRTARHHLQRLTLLGLVEQQALFGGLVSRQVNPSTYTRAQKMLVKRFNDAVIPLDCGAAV